MWNQLLQLHVTSTHKTERFQIAYSSHHRSERHRAIACSSLQPIASTFHVLSLLHIFSAYKQTQIQISQTEPSPQNQRDRKSPLNKNSSSKSKSPQNKITSPQQKRLTSVSASKSEAKTMDNNSTTNPCSLIYALV